MVVLDFTTYAGEPVPELLKLQLTRAATGVVLDTTYFNTAGFSGTTNQVHRLVVPVPAADLGLSTGVYLVRVSMTRKVNGIWESPADTTSTRLIVVDRSRSRFGAGWWPAGVDRLYPQPAGEPAGRLLVLGDGSALFYAWQGAGYERPPGEYSTLDSLAAGFRRTLPGGRVRIWYSSAGLVDSITDNNPSRNKASYTWVAGGADGYKLTAITDPVGKQVTLRVRRLHGPRRGSARRAPVTFSATRWRR